MNKLGGGEAGTAARFAGGEAAVVGKFQRRAPGGDLGRSRSTTR
jgi:hypothetical protein